MIVSGQMVPCVFPCNEGAVSVMVQKKQITGRLETGLTHTRKLVVDDSLTVPRLPAAVGDLSDMPQVLATANVLAFVEATCIEALRPYLDKGQNTVGTQINFSHSAATPVGMAVSATVTLSAIEGRCLRFDVECLDEHGLIGAGSHERFIIDSARFEARIEAKRAAGE